MEDDEHTSTKNKLVLKYKYTTEENEISRCTARIVASSLVSGGMPAYYCQSKF